MADEEKKVDRGSGTDAQFRAVVKRLLDTPPMHKTAKTGGAERRQPRKAKPKAD